AAVGRAEHTAGQERAVFVESPIFEPTQFRVSLPNVAADGDGAALRSRPGVGRRIRPEAVVGIAVIVVVHVDLPGHLVEGRDVPRIWADRVGPGGTKTIPVVQVAGDRLARLFLVGPRAN